MKYVTNSSPVYLSGTEHARSVTIPDDAVGISIVNLDDLRFRVCWLEPKQLDSPYLSDPYAY